MDASASPSTSPLDGGSSLLALRRSAHDGSSRWQFVPPSLARLAELAATAIVGSELSCSRESLAPLLAVSSAGRMCLHELLGASVFTHVVHDASDPSMVDQTSSRLWHAATVLIDHLHLTRALTPGDRLCELGAGCGAVGLTSHFGQGVDVTLTDLPAALPLLHLNVGHNIRQQPVPSRRRLPRVAPLIWGDAAAASSVLRSTPGQRFDLIIGSDVTYEPSDHVALLETMAALANGGCHDDDGSASSAARAPAPVLVAVADWMQPGKAHSRFLRDTWLATAEALGWHWEVVRTIREEEARRMRAELSVAAQSAHERAPPAPSSASDTEAMPVVILRGTAPPRRPSLLGERIAASPDVAASSRDYLLLGTT